MRQGSRVRHRRNAKLGHITVVNPHFGWFKVQWDDGHVKEYRMETYKMTLTVLQ